MYSYSDFTRRYKDLSNMSHIEALGWYTGLDGEAKEEYQKIDLDDLTNHIQSILSKEIVFDLEFYSKRYNRNITAIKNKYPKSNIKVALINYENELIDDFRKIPVTITDIFGRKESLGEGYFKDLSDEVVRYIDNMYNYIERLIYITELRQNYKQYLDSYYEYFAMITAKKEKPKKRLHELFEDIHQYVQLVKDLKSNEIINELSGFEDQYEFDPQFINSQGIAPPRALAALAYFIYINKYLLKKTKQFEIADAMKIFLNLEFDQEAFNKSWRMFRSQADKFIKSKYGSAFDLLFK